MNFIGIPIIYPKAHLIKKQFNELLLQNPYVNKVIIPQWKKLDANEIKKLKFSEKYYISQTPLLTHSKRLLLCKFKTNKAYLYNPESGIFYLFGNVQVFTNVKSFILDVQMVRKGLGNGLIYIRDVFVWDSIYLADLHFEDRKQISDVISNSIETEYLFWNFYPTKFVYFKKDLNDAYHQCILEESDIQKSLKV
jgi:hypothetical protein